MFADVDLEGAGESSAVSIPRAAVQDVDDRTVVYVADPKQTGRFIERDVRLGRASGNDVEVVGGVVTGESVVAEGSFFVRAERDRLGLGSAPSSTQEAKVMVTEKGYEPASLTLRAGIPARITFLRTTDATCGTEVVFPTLDIRRALPLNQAVTIDFTPRTSGELNFVCGMDMLHGSIVVR